MSARRARTNGQRRGTQGAASYSHRSRPELGRGPLAAPAGVRRSLERNGRIVTSSIRNPRHAKALPADGSGSGRLHGLGSRRRLRRRRHGQANVNNIFDSDFNLDPNAVVLESDRRFSSDRLFRVSRRTTSISATRPNTSGSARQVRMPRRLPPMASGSCRSPTSTSTAKRALARWQLNGDIQGAGQLFAFDDHGTQFAYGAGAQANWGAFSARFEYDGFQHAQYRRARHVYDRCDLDFPPVAARIELSGAKCLIRLVNIRTARAELCAARCV